MILRRGSGTARVRPSNEMENADTAWRRSQAADVLVVVESGSDRGDRLTGNRFAIKIMILLGHINFMQAS